MDKTKQGPNSNIACNKTVQGLNNNVHNKITFNKTGLSTSSSSNKESGNEITTFNKTIKTLKYKTGLSASSSSNKEESGKSHRER